MVPCRALQPNSYPACSGPVWLGPRLPRCTRTSGARSLSKVPCSWKGAALCGTSWTTSGFCDFWSTTRRSSKANTIVWLSSVHPGAVIDEAFCRQGAAEMGAMWQTTSEAEVRGASRMGQKRFVGLPPTSRLANCFRVFMFLNSLLFLRLRLGHQEHTHTHTSIWTTKHNRVIFWPPELSSLGFLCPKNQAPTGKAGKTRSAKQRFLQGIQSRLQVLFASENPLVWSSYLPLLERKLERLCQPQWQENSKDFANQAGDDLWCNLTVLGLVWAGVCFSGLLFIFVYHLYGPSRELPLRWLGIWYYANEFICVRRPLVFLVVLFQNRFSCS